MIHRRPPRTSRTVRFHCGALDRLAFELQPDKQQGGIQHEDLAPLLRSDIGYSVIGRSTVVAILGAFSASLLIVGWVVRRSRSPAVAGWLAPATAIAAGAILVALGTARRQAVPPTAGSVAVVHVVPGNDEAVADGLFAVYRPSAGPVHLSTDRGGAVELDTAGLQGEVLRRMVTDVDRWEVEGMALPAGVRTGPFRATLAAGGASVVGRFGPNGFEGKLVADRCRT